jgi:pSer/pThr/pTyr-binding forkhead associated (FHA) protein
MAKVIMKFEDRVIEEVLLDKTAIAIGRNPDNDVRIDNLAVSGFHARLLKEGESFFIEDLKSLNGIFVGGRKVSRHELKHNDEITIGKHTLVFVDRTEDVPRGVDAMSFDSTMMLDTKKHREVMSKKLPETSLPQDRVGLLTVLDGAAERSKYEFRERFATIGRGKSADIRIKGFFAPEIAALLQRTDEGFFVSPPDRGKKPKVNGEPISGRTELKEGDTLQAGRVLMVFSLKEVKEDKGTGG